MREPVARMLRRLAAPMLAAMMAAAPAVAQDQQPEGKPDAKPEMKSAVWCDTSDQIETVMRAHHTDGIPLRVAIERVNALANDPGACIAAVAMVVKLDQPRRLFVGKTVKSVMVIDTFLILGVLTRRAGGGMAVLQSPQTWYSAEVLAESQEM